MKTVHQLNYSEENCSEYRKVEAEWMTHWVRLHVHVCYIRRMPQMAELNTLAHVITNTNIITFTYTVVVAFSTESLRGKTKWTCIRAQDSGSRTIQHQWVLYIIATKNILFTLQIITLNSRVREYLCNLYF